jgi:hypothetical protein
MGESGETLDLGDLIVTEVEIYEVGQSGEALYF